jgi:hypothetical protein
MCFMAKIRLFGQPQGTWVSLETNKLASRYLDKLFNTWIILEVFGMAMEHLVQPQGTCISYGTLVSALKHSS